MVRTMGSVDEDGTVLRRIERLAAGYGVLGAVAYGLLAHWPGAAALTLTAAASIVNFRGLEAFSLLFEPQLQGKLGARNTLLVLLRLLFLAGVVSAVLILGSRYVLALILGVSVIPAALITEAGIEAWGLLRKNGDGR